MMKVSLNIPNAFRPLLTENKRYKFYYGGRGGGKSYGFADSLLVKGYQGKYFIACLREIQNSIKDSVHKLLSDRISYYNLYDYKIYEDRIENVRTGTKIIFKGLRDQDNAKIKSLEGVDIAWIEEAHTITKKSWEILDPTIRKDGSEIWISMNREDETDPLWLALAANPDERTLVRKVNYYDNPFCPEELKAQALKCKESDFESYLHIWEGEPLGQAVLKLIAAKDVRNALEQKNISDNKMLPLIIGVDVARFGDDRTAICRRRGRKAWGMQILKGKDTIEVANVLTSIILKEAPARVNIDAGQNGAGVIDVLKHRGYGNIIGEVNFGAAAQNPEVYGNRRAEMWDRLNEWLKSPSPVSLVDMDDIQKELTAPQKEYDNRSRLFLEKKKDVKKRLGFSPDLADALALTFAEADYPSSIHTDFEQRVDGNVYWEAVDTNFYYD